MKLFRRLLFFTLLFTFPFTQPIGASSPSLLPLKERAKVINKWLEIRLENVLPEIMRREKFDMWIIICREYNEDPIYFTLVPATSFSARRTTLVTMAEAKMERQSSCGTSRLRPGYGRGDQSPGHQITDSGLHHHGGSVMH